MGGEKGKISVPRMEGRMGSNKGKLQDVEQQWRREGEGYA
jgi:hypothetical protein